MPQLPTPVAWWRAWQLSLEWGLVEELGPHQEKTKQLPGVGTKVSQRWAKK